jgi:protein-L-isoaspartate(D-aspartate) O-methyltransferase
VARPYHYEHAGPYPGRGVARLIRESAEPFGYIEEADFGPLLDRIGDARLVLLGEATHGTSEFYRMRARITRELILRAGFTVIAVEADWPDARWVDAYVCHALEPPSEISPSGGSPRWMWRNREVSEFVDWLRPHNGAVTHRDDRVGFYGLDLYSLFASLDSVIRYLDRADPDRRRPGAGTLRCLAPWIDEPSAYGRAAITETYRSCEPEVLATLDDLLTRRTDYIARGGSDRYLDAVQNARLVVNAERYYRVMYQGSTESWNLRDEHMFETLQSVLDARGPGTRRSDLGA